VTLAAVRLDAPPFRLTNRLSVPLLISQQGVPGLMTHVPPGSGTPYILDAPSLPPLMCLRVPDLAGGSLVATVDMSRLGEQTRIELADGRSLWCLVQPEGVTRSLLLAEAPLLPNGAASLVEGERQPVAVLSFHASRLGVSLVNRQPQELLFLSAQQLRVCAALTVAAVSLDASLRSLQLDNQLEKTSYPVLLRASPRPGAAAPAVVELSSVKLRHCSDLHYYRSCEVRAAPLDLALDLRALLAAGEVALRLASLARPPPPPRAQPTPIASFATALHLPRHRRTTAGLRHLQHAAGGGGMPSPAPRKCYFQSLTLHPIALSYAASTSGFAELKTLVTALVAALQPAGAAPPAWAVAMLSALGAAVASVDLARLTFAALVLRDALDELPRLLGRIGKHYSLQASQALLRVAGDLDALGSPIAVLAGIGSGLRDFVQEPARCLLERRGNELHLAVARGTSSLLRNTLASTALATAKVSGTLGHGLAALTLDDDFVRRRAARRAAQRPASLAEGLRDGASNLRASVQDGASGLASPVRGLRDGGSVGRALVGAAQGVVSAALKPASGVLDMVETMCATAAVSGPAVHSASVRPRARPPRALASDAALQPYDQSVRGGQELLQRVEAGAYRGDLLLEHVGLGPRTLICTDARALLVRSGSLDLSWQAPWHQLRGVELQPARYVVRLQLDTRQSHKIECGSAGATKLVYATVMRMRARYAEALVAGALAGCTQEQRQLQAATA